MPYEKRLAFWRRTKARLDERKRERQAEQLRDQMSIYEWAGTHGVNDVFDPFKDVITEGELDAVALGNRIEPYLSDGVHPWNPTPVSSARRTPTHDAVLEKIRRNTVDVEPVLDVAEMIVAHRNGATALERPMTIDEQCESPVWEELVERMWDPTHERGPRERDWVRQQHKRNQPERQSRAQRKGKR